MLRIRRLGPAAAWLTSGGGAGASSEALWTAIMLPLLRRAADWSTPRRGICSARVWPACSLVVPAPCLSLSSCSSPPLSPSRRVDRKHGPAHLLPLHVDARAELGRLLGRGLRDEGSGGTCSRRHASRESWTSIASRTGDAEHLQVHPESLAGGRRGPPTYRASGEAEVWQVGPRSPPDLIDPEAAAIEAGDEGACAFPAPGITSNSTP